MGKGGKLRLQANDSIKQLELPGIDGTIFNLEQVRDKRFMLSFFRFAACPFCNLRIHQLVSRFEEFGSNFTIIAVFDSPLDNLQRFTEKHEAPFPILADHTNKYYRQYGVERSFYGMLKGMIGRLPKLLYGMLVKGYLPFPFKGNLLTMPVDILVGENGLVKMAYYGKDEGDHLPFEVIKDFSHGT